MPTAAERLHLLYDMSRRLTSFTDLEDLLRYATRRARELFVADGCALLLLDRERREFYFPIASQSASRSTVEARLKELRFPADRGIAGWVLERSETALVEDVTKDPRFYAGVDRQTDMTTRRLMCAPLRSAEGNIGVIEVVNPREASTPEDTDFLEALAGDIAVAYEKVLLLERLRGEALGLRQVCGWIGTGLLVIGMLLALGATLGHLALALPLSTLPGRPGMLVGLGALAIGGLLFATARGWLVRPVSPARPAVP
jgi:GAF domain-containing protein